MHERVGSITMQRNKIDWWVPHGERKGAGGAVQARNA